VISVEAEKPLIAFSPLDNCQALEEVTKAAVRWGAILLLDMRNIPTEQRSSRGKCQVSLLDIIEKLLKQFKLLRLTSGYYCLFLSKRHVDIV
jgi:hypothetical protein